jgi:hypothetical protein
LFSAIYIGGLFILLAIVYLVNLPINLWDKIVEFFTSLTLAQIPGTGISLPAPANPAAHIELYTAAFQFIIGVAILEIVVLTLRILFHSPMARKAETIENIVFTLATSYLISAYLFNITITSEWFVFWSGIILIFGTSLLVRGIVLLIAQRRHLT